MCIDGDLGRHPQAAGFVDTAQSVSVHAVLYTVMYKLLLYYFWLYGIAINMIELMVWDHHYSYTYPTRMRKG